MIRLLTRSTRIYSTNPLLKREIAEEVLYIKKHEKESLEKLLKTLSERKEGENEMLAKEEDVSVSLSIELTSTNEKTGESKKQVIDAMYGSVNGNVTGTIGRRGHAIEDQYFRQHDKDLINNMNKNTTKVDQGKNKKEEQDVKK